MDAAQMWSLATRGAVRCVGWVMAVAGFSLSIAAPVVAAFVPLLRVKPPALLTYGSYPEKRQSNALSRAKPNSVIVPLSSTSTTPDIDLSSDADTSLATCPPIPQDTSSAAPVNKNNTADHQAIPQKPHRHICSPKRCATRASTSSSSSSSSSSLDLLNDRSKVGENSPASREAPARHAHGAVMEVLSPIASDEGEYNLDLDIIDAKGKHRSWGLFHLKKSSKRRAAQSEASSDSPRCHSAPGSRRNSFSMSPARTMVSLPDHIAFDTPSGDPSETRTGRRGLMKKPGCLRKLSSKSKRKEAVRRRDSLVELAPSEVTVVGSGESSGRKARKRCKKQSRKEPSPPPPRTRPYEAPYFFPAPDSEDAFNYAQRIRTEMRLSSSPPATSKSFPEAASQATSQHKDGSEEHISPLLHSETMPAQSAPAHKTTFSHKLFSRPSRHRKSSSADSASDLTLGADEFGFANAGAGQGEGSHGSVPGRHVRLVPERAVSSPGPRVMQPLTSSPSAAPRPILKHSL